MRIYKFIDVKDMTEEDVSKLCEKFKTHFGFEVSEKLLEPGKCELQNVLLDKINGSKFKENLKK